MKKVIRIPRDAELPLIGAIMFGIIDRGTNLLQIRPTSVCNLNCIFCSTDAGPFSKTRVNDYEVELSYLVDWFKEIAKFKEYNHLIAFIDSVGDPLTYPKIVDLVQELNDVKVENIAIETNGTLLSEELIDELKEVGLKQINLSLHALDKELAKKLSGTDFYRVEKILKMAKYVVEKNIELTITPVWIPKINDKEIEKIILFSKEINRNKKFPPLGIQKYQVHKYGRKVKGVKEIRWYYFYKKLEEWEKKFDYKVKIGPRDFKIFKWKPLPKPFKKRDKIKVEIKCNGWLKNEMIGEAKNRCISVLDVKAKEGDLVNVEIIRDKDNLYLGKPLRKKVEKAILMDYDKLF